MKKADSGSTLLIFAKFPVPGKVKTRLAASIGHEQAMQVYRRFVRHIIGCAKAQPAINQVWVDVGPAASCAAFAEQFPGADRYRGQLESPDLGERMLHAFKTAHEQGADKLVMIGTDSPALPPSILGEAFTALEGCDVVYGPALDGGYYLVGMREPQPMLFHDIAWSTGNVLQASLNKARIADLHYVLLPEHYDVDHVEDLQKLQQEMPELLHGLDLTLSNDAERDI